MTKGGQHLYVIQSAVTGSFKIGRSSDVDKRLRQLQTGSPYPLRVVLVLEDMGGLEKGLHQRLADFKSQGEWFIEPGIASLPDSLYEKLDPCVMACWWEDPSIGTVHVPWPTVHLPTLNIPKQK